MTAIAAWFFSAASQVRAIPPPTAPRGRPSAEPSVAATPVGPVLPYGSPVFFVLDDKIDSGKTPVGAVIRLHLRAPLVVNGVALAPAGAPATLTLVTRRKASMGNENGSIAIHLDPLALPTIGKTLPLRMEREYLTVEKTAGQTATGNMVDTIGDIFIPYHQLYHYLRPGQQFVLPPGTVLRAVTEMTIDATDPKTVVIGTPPPFESTYDTPHADLTPAPFYTPAPQRPKPLPKGKATIPPTVAPSEPASASPAASGSPATASAAATGSPPAAASPSASGASPSASPGR